jgi:transposase
MTNRLREALVALGLATSAEVSERLAPSLGMLISAPTLLRRLRVVACPPPQSVRVLGVDDWAWKKGQLYGTLLVDLERRKPIEVLPDRREKTVTAWLQTHPEIEVISRDRGGEYAAAAKKGAPQALQIADKFHLLLNLREKLKELMARKQKLLPQVEVIPSKPVADTAREAPSASASSSSCPVGGSKSFRHMSPYPRATPSGSVAIPPEETPSQISRANRYARYEAVGTLHQQLVSQREIARRLSLSRNTVRKFLQAETFPERSPRPYRSSLLDAYKPYILERWKAGCWNGMQLLDEIKQRGYTGSEALLRYFLTQVRKQHRAAGTALALELSAAQGSVSTSSALPPKPPPKRRISPSRASWLCMCQPDKLDEQQRPLVEQLRAAHPDLETAYQLSQAFVSMLAEQRAQDLDDWLLQAKQSGIRELKSFAQGIRRDYAAVKAAFSSHWSNGQVEAQVNCLKLQKRLMFGRANFDLLRLHVLRRA